MNSKTTNSLSVFLRIPKINFLLYWRFSRKTEITRLDKATRKTYFPNKNKWIINGIAQYRTHFIVLRYAHITFLVESLDKYLRTGFRMKCFDFEINGTLKFAESPINILFFIYSGISRYYNKSPVNILLDTG